MPLATGIIFGPSTRQNINTENSTEAKFVGIYGAVDSIIYQARCYHDQEGWFSFYV
jgi:hypothetical protein